MFACRRRRTKPYKLPPMPNIQETRVKRSKLFEQVGLDYMGPITVKHNNEKSKRWVALFTCFATRPVHLELVENLSAESFMHALEDSSHVEDVPNLFPVITPIDFISPNVPSNTPSNHECDQEEFILHTPNTRDKLINYWSNTLKTLDVFWENWKNEYLISLGERTQRELASPRLVDKRIPSAGEIVLLNGPELLRDMWKLVRIETLKLDSDGNIRNATVKTSSGKLLNRPINLLYPMEVNEEESDEVRTTKSKDETDDGPIALRTRGAERKQKLLQTSMVQGASSITLMVTITFSLLIQVTSAHRCNWITGIPLNLPQKGNCNDQSMQNYTLNTQELMQEYEQHNAVTSLEWYVQRPF
uniref:DUF5641 domain-containing protein n=1 Tax=Loa loa TaxID=7209 RepID=A0A1I7VRD7_LOALO